MGSGQAARFEVERTECRNPDAYHSYCYFCASPGEIGYEVYWILLDYFDFLHGEESLTSIVENI